MTFVRFASLAGLAVSATALAGPTTPDQQNLGRAKQQALIPPSPEGVQAFCENFDSYPVGQGLHGRGGWEPWGGAAPDGLIVVGPPGSTSGGNALEYQAALNDNVHRMGFSNGTFYASTMVYFPSNPPAGNDGYIILCNLYGGTGTTGDTTWASQVRFSHFDSTVRNDAGGFAAAPTLPLVRDQWVLWEAMIDVATPSDRFHDVYGGQQLTVSENTTPGVIMKWTDNGLNGPANPGGSPPAIAAVDLYSNSVQGMLTDDFVVTCFADLDQSTGCGTVDIFDFLAFQNKFGANNPIACNADTSTGLGTCDIFDFLFFQNQFALGNCQ